MLLKGVGSYFEMCPRHIDCKGPLGGSADPPGGHPARASSFGNAQPSSKRTGEDGQGTKFQSFKVSFLIRFSNYECQRPPT